MRDWYVSYGHGDAVHKVHLVEVPWWALALRQVVGAADAATHCRVRPLCRLAAWADCAVDEREHEVSCVRVSGDVAEALGFRWGADENA